MLDRSEQLEAVYAKYRNPPPKNKPTGRGSLLARSPQDYEADKRYLEIGLEKDQELIYRWNGKRPIGNESDDDLGFLNKLAYWTNNNGLLMREAFLNSPYFGQKDDFHVGKCIERKDYLERTIKKAIEGTPTTARDDGKAYRLNKSIISGTNGNFNNNLPWESPTPLYSIVVPPFPVECLPSVLRNYAIAVSESTQTPVDMASVKLLAAAAICLQGKCRISGKPDWTEPLNLFAVNIMPPAERKSAVDSHICQYHQEYEKLKNQENKEAVNRSKIKKAALEKTINDIKNKYAKDKASEAELFAAQDELTNFEEVKPLRLIADDVTPEALASLLAENGGRMAIVSSEGGIFEIMGGRYSQSTNIDVFLKGHSGDPVHVDRKGRESEYIETPCLTVSLSIQPQVLEGIMNNPIFKGRGLCARFFYSIPASKVGTREFETPSIPDDTKKEYRDLIFELLDLEQPNEPIILELSGEAHNISAKFAKDLEPRLINDLADIADWAGKLHGAVLRIAGILHCVEQTESAFKTPISVDTIQAAINIGDYFLEHAKAAYLMMGADESTREAKYVLNKIKEQQLKEFTKRGLIRICRKYKSVGDLTPPLEVLENHNYIRVSASTMAGNNLSVDTYSVNPNLILM